jgi:O-antigen/teichoic acid export membrane protein
MPRLSRNFAFNLAGYALPLALAVVAMPYLARHAGVDRFGFLTLAWAVIGYFGFLDLGLSRVFARRVAQARTPGELASELRLLGQIGRKLSVLAAAVGLALALVVPSSWLAGTTASAQFLSEVRWAWLILVATLPAVVMSNLWRGAMEGREAFDAVNLFRVVFGSWTFAAPLAALAWTDSLPALVLAMAIGRWLGALCHWAWCVRNLPRPGVVVAEGSSEAVRLALVEGAWITVSNGLGPLMAFIDRFVLAGLLSLGSVAVYSVPQEIALRLLFIPGAFAVALFPRLAALASAQDPGTSARIAEKASRMCLALTLPACIVACVLARPGLQIWLGPAFADLGAPVLQCLMIGVVVSAPAQIAFTKLQAVGRARASAQLHMAELVPYGILLWLAASRFGVLGAATVWTMRVLVDAALLIVLMRRIDRRSFGVRSLIAVGAAMVAIVVIIVAVDRVEPLAAKLGLIALSAAVAMGLVLSAAEWREAFGVLYELRRSLVRNSA